MRVPLLDLVRQYETIKDEVLEAVLKVIETQQFIMGPQVTSCEAAIACYCGCAHAVGVSSGTDAILLALMAEGVGAGDEVITTPYTFFATAGSIARLGAVPVFVDIDPVTLNIRPDLVEAAVSKKTRAIMPVHLFGQMADMNPILEIASRYQLVVIEDAAQSIGAEYEGRRAGSLGSYGCFSFFPSKNLGAFGDAGMVVTNSAERTRQLEVLRAHGSSRKYYHRLVGGNFRLDTLQAAVVEVKLRYLDRWTSQRQSNAERYNRLFESSGLVREGHVRLPSVVRDRHIFNQYVIRAESRNALQAHLRQREIGTEIYYPVPLHLQECFVHLGCGPGSFPAAEEAAGETLALPVFPELTADEAEAVVGAMREFYSCR